MGMAAIQTVFLSQASSAWTVTFGVLTRATSCAAMAFCGTTWTPPSATMATCTPVTVVVQAVR